MDGFVEAVLSHAALVGKEGWMPRKLLLSSLRILGDHRHQQTGASGNSLYYACSTGNCDGGYCLTLESKTQANQQVHWRLKSVASIKPHILECSGRHAISGKTSVKTRFLMKKAINKNPNATGAQVKAALYASGQCKQHVTMQEIQNFQKHARERPTPGSSTDRLIALKHVFDEISIVMWETIKEGQQSRTRTVRTFKQARRLLTILREEGVVEFAPFSVDGTFSISKDFAQVLFFGIQLHYRERVTQKGVSATILPVAVCFLQSKQQEDYEWFLTIVRDFLKKHGLPMPQYTMCDGEPGLIRALANAFPDSEQRLCWFHVKNKSAIRKQAIRYGVPHEALGLLMNDVEKLHEACDVQTMRSDDWVNFRAKYSRYQRFLNYFGTLFDLNGVCSPFASHTQPRRRAARGRAPSRSDSAGRRPGTPCRGRPPTTPAASVRRTPESGRAPAHPDSRTRAWPPVAVCPPGSSSTWAA